MTLEVNSVNRRGSSSRPSAAGVIQKRSPKVLVTTQPVNVATVAAGAVNGTTNQSLL